MRGKCLHVVMTKNESRYVYIFGCKSLSSAERALENAYNNCEISDCEKPEIESYHVKKLAKNPYGELIDIAEKRWRITLLDLV